MGKKKDLVKEVLEGILEYFAEAGDNKNVTVEPQENGSYVVWGKKGERPFEMDEAAETPMRLDVGKVKWRCKVCDPYYCELETCGYGDDPIECPVSRCGAAFWVEVEESYGKI